MDKCSCWVILQSEWEAEKNPTYAFIGFFFLLAFQTNCRKGIVHVHISTGADPEQVKWHRHIPFQVNNVFGSTAHQSPKQVRISSFPSSCSAAPLFQSPPLSSSPHCCYCPLMPQGRAGVRVQNYSRLLQLGSAGTWAHLGTAPAAVRFQVTISPQVSPASLGGTGERNPPTATAVSGWASL